MEGVGERFAEAAREWVRESCAAQGLPEKVDDPTVLRDVVTLLGQADGGPRQP